MIFDKAAPVRIIVAPMLFQIIDYNYINYLMYLNINYYFTIIACFTSCLKLFDVIWRNF